MMSSYFEKELFYDGIYERGADLTKVRKLLAGASLLLIATACVSEGADFPAKSQPEFNQPPTAEYFLNDKDNYYDELKSTLKQTHNKEAINNIERLLTIPVAQWLNGSIDDTRKVLASNLDTSKPHGKIPIFVAYNIPDRDLGGQAGGGMSTPEAYQQWIRMISDTIDDAPAVMILEPDALAGIPQMKDEQKRKERIDLLHDALSTFKKNNAKMAAYLDAGNSGWLSAATVSDLLRQVDPDGRLIGGVALNVSNRRSDTETRAYADAISEKLGRKLHVMIDNSRNGASNTDSLQGWCNVKGEHIGTVPDIVYSASQDVEQAFIKTPGESDGDCGSSNKPPGEFDSHLLIKLVT